MRGAVTRSEQPRGRPSGVSAAPLAILAWSTRPLELVMRFCEELRRAGVSYCHWKSTDALHLSATGVNDLDLLVERGHAGAFLEVLARLGFKEAVPPKHRRRPGVQHYYGLDDQTGVLVHVDAQYSLWLGDDTTKNVRLPMERAYLASAEQGPLFAVPAFEFELAVLIVRLALKRGTWDAAAFGMAGLQDNERRELEYLWARSDPDTLRDVVESHLTMVGWPAWSAFFQALLLRQSLARQLVTGRRVVSSLRSCARRRPALDTVVRCRRRISWGLRHYLLRSRNSKTLVSGGAVIAVIGGDGAGKSTAVEGLCAWLGGPLPVRRVHLGKPPRSLATVLVKGSIVVARRVGLVRSPWLPNYPTGDETLGRPPGYAWLLWQLMTARDRRRHHRRVRRQAARGHLLVCDRYPLPQLTLMDGSRTRWLSRASLPPVAARLAALEQRWYADIGEPDVTLVLRVDPDVAVARKVGVDPAEFVRPRVAEVFDADWAGTGAVVLDACQPAAEVLAQMRAAVWERL